MASTDDTYFRRIGPDEPTSYTLYATRWSTRRVPMYPLTPKKEKLKFYVFEYLSPF